MPSGGTCSTAALVTGSKLLKDEFSDSIKEGVNSKLRNKVLLVVGFRLNLALDDFFLKIQYFERKVISAFSFA